MRTLNRLFLYIIFGFVMFLTSTSILGESIDPGLIVYDAPLGAGHNNDYTVQVLKEGGEWLNLFGYNAVNMNKGPYLGSAPTPLNNQTFAYFDSDFRQRIEVKVTRNAKQGKFQIGPYATNVVFK